jgi:hypothetical protein
MWDTCAPTFLASFGSSLGNLFQSTKLTFIGPNCTFLWWLKIQTWNDVTCQVVGVLYTHPNEQIQKATAQWLLNSLVFVLPFSHVLFQSESTPT